jgi:hypothetical protein
LKEARRKARKEYDAMMKEKSGDPFDEIAATLWRGLLAGVGDSAIHEIRCALYEAAAIQREIDAEIAESAAAAIRGRKKPVVCVR